MDEIDQVKKKMLEEITPSEEERTETKEKFKDIRDFIKKEFGLEAELMGSVAKDSYLKGNKDLDIFVFFPEEKKEEELEERGLEVGKSVFNHFNGEFKVDYAEHPYTKGVIDNFEVEIVPCYRIEEASDLKSSVDRTPFHTKWVNGNLSEKEKNEVIIFKKFLRARGLYGSSLKIEGFSGYLCELLITKYESFEKVLKEAQEWEYKQKIDPQGHWKKGKEIKIPDSIWKKFKEDCLIVIDPVDPERNVASVLSEENYAKFIYEAWKFLENPSKDFFYPEEAKFKEKELKERLNSHGKILNVEFSNPGVIHDILYPQLRRTLKRIEKELTQNEFELFEKGIFVEEDKIRLIFDFKVWELPQARKQKGPQIYHNQEHLEQFRDKYDNVWIEDSRLVTIVEREFRRPEELLKNFLEGSPGELEKRGIPENIAEVMEGFEIKEVQGVEENKEWEKFLYKFLNPSAKS